MNKQREEFEAYKNFAINNILSVSGKSKLIEIISKHIETVFILGQASSIPEGHVIAPKEPTEKMIKAGQEQQCDPFLDTDGIYKAMIEAQKQNDE